MKKFLIIPAYNEESAIARVVSEAKFYVDKVVVVDDASTDKTGVIARANGACVLRHVINRGYGASLNTGSLWSIDNGADIIIHFDADGQHSAADIPSFIKPIETQECEIVLGSRFLDSVLISPPFSRKVLLKFATVFTNFFHGIRVTDTHNGFRAFSSRAYLQMDLRQDRMAYSSEVLAEIARLDLRFIEVPTNIVYSAYSKSKGQSFAGAFQILWQLARNRLIK